MVVKIKQIVCQHEFQESLSLFRLLFRIVTVQGPLAENDKSDDYWRVLASIDGNKINKKVLN